MSEDTRKAYAYFSIWRDKSNRVTCGECGAPGECNIYERKGGMPAFYCEEHGRGRLLAFNPARACRLALRLRRAKDWESWDEHERAGMVAIEVERMLRDVRQSAIREGEDVAPQQLGLHAPAVSKRKIEADLLARTGERIENINKRPKVQGELF